VLRLLRTITTHTMSDNEKIMSDADKIRLKRLARLGAPSASVASQPQASTSHDEAPAPRPAPSAASRSLDTAQQASSATKTPQASSSKEINRAPIPRAKKAPVPAEASIARKPPAQARLPKPYPEWEAQKVQDIFSVTLSVSHHCYTRLSIARHRSTK
jgi:ubiquitin conjugation factor E4 B